MDRQRLKTHLADCVAVERGAGWRACSGAEQAAHEVRKWRLAEAALRSAVIPVKASLPRSRQWQAAARLVRDVAPLPEIVDYALEQASIHRNHERGIRDMRPCRQVSCRQALLDHVASRRRKAEVVAGWLDAAIGQGADLARLPSRVFTSPERAPPRLGNPLSRDDGEDGSGS